MKARRRGATYGLVVPGGLEADSVAGPSARAAIVHLETVFVQRGAVGPIVAVRAAADWVRMAPTA